MKQKTSVSYTALQFNTLPGWARDVILAHEKALAEIASYPAAQHTPGPWNISGFYAMTGRTCFPITAKGDFIVAEVKFHRAESEACEANAALIASAPELLEALENCVAILSMSDVKHLICDGGTGNLGEAAWYQREVAIARAAIARARPSA